MCCFTGRSSLCIKIGRWVGHIHFEPFNGSTKARYWLTFAAFSHLRNYFRCKLKVPSVIIFTCFHNSTACACGASASRRTSSTPTARPTAGSARSAAAGTRRATSASRSAASARCRPTTTAATRPPRSGAASSAARTSTRRGGRSGACPRCASGTNCDNVLRGKVYPLDALERRERVRRVRRARAL